MPARPLDATAVAALVSAATAAPSMHNAQPWRFSFHAAARAFELRADPRRGMEHADPAHRALHIGCGAALCNLRVAAAHDGWAVATELLPVPGDPELLAAVRLDDAGQPDARLGALQPEIPRRHTSRWPFADKEVPPEVRAELTEAAGAEGVQLAFPDRWHTHTLLDLVQDAEGRDAQEPERAAEVARWSRTGGDTAPEGVPDYAFGPRKRSGGAPARDFAGRAAVPGRGSVPFEHTPNLALLGTARDEPADWLRAGQAMERVLLLATRHGLATSLTSHALEWSDLRLLVRDPTSGMGYVQMVLRLGYGPEGPGTPRRDVRDVLVIEEE